MNIRQLKKCYQHAYAAFDAGRLDKAAALFARLVRHMPDDPDCNYMQGLTAKNRQDWPTALAANLRAVALAPEFNQAAHWNAAIAATALHDWPTARRLWTACGIELPEGTGEIRNDYGMAVVRLNPWADGECVYVRRIDPVRAEILNVPFPRSGWRLGDIVLHDGAPSGERHDGQGNTVLVFNGLMRWQRSDWLTHTVFAECAGADAADLLRRLQQHGLYGEDWTDNVRHLCLRCSYGRVHSHHPPVAGGEGPTERSIGIGTDDAAALQHLLAAWVADAPERRSVTEVCQEEYPLPDRQDGKVWWA